MDKDTAVKVVNTLEKALTIIETIDSINPGERENLSEVYDIVNTVIHAIALQDIHGKFPVEGPERDDNNG